MLVSVRIWFFSILQRGTLFEVGLGLAGSFARSLVGNPGFEVDLVLYLVFGLQCNRYRSLVCSLDLEADLAFYLLPGLLLSH